MTHITILEHCESVGKDKYGLTNCRLCPADVRIECHKQVPLTYEAIRDKEARMLELLNPPKPVL